MRLSDAIRLGAMLKPQCFGDLWINDGSCALGAAYEAAGIMTPDMLRAFRSANGIEELLTIVRSRRAFPILAVSQGCPCCQFGGVRGNMGEVIGHLNDWHRWTREAIADWVATLESADERSESPEAADAVSPSRSHGHRLTLRVS